MISYDFRGIFYRKWWSQDFYLTFLWTLSNFLVAQCDLFQSKLDGNRLESFEAKFDTENPSTTSPCNFLCLENFLKGPIDYENGHIQQRKPCKSASFNI